MTTKRNLDMQAKKQAIHDIKEALKEEHKIFLLFREELNPVMEELVNEYSGLEV